MLECNLNDQERWCQKMKLKACPVKISGCHLRALPRIKILTCCATWSWSLKKRIRRRLKRMKMMKLDQVEQEPEQKYALTVPKILRILAEDGA